MLTSLRAILRSAARTLGVERAANAALIMEMWADIVGLPAGAHSRVLGLRGAVVLAEAEAGPWAQEISARRGGYIAEINRRLGAEVVAEIRVSQTAVPFPAMPPRGTTGPRRAADGRGDPGRLADGEELSPQDLAGVERAVSEIKDPEIRAGARRAMISQVKWRRRREAEGGSPPGAGGGGDGDVRASGR